MIPLSHDVKKINKELTKIYGNLYRLVFSDNEREMRKGEFNVFYGQLFLRTEIGVREVKKYPYIKSKYVLEKYVPPPLSFISEVPESVHGSYEPLYIFEDKDGNYLKPILRVALMVCYANQNPVDYWKRKNQLDDEEKKQEQADYDAVYLGVDRTPIGFALSNGEGITVPSNFKKGD